MNRLDRFRFGNLHKRRIFGVVAIFVLIAFVAASFLAVLGIFGSRSELPRVNLTANSTADTIQGVGFNILDIPDSNIIEDPFFDSKDNCSFATVVMADGNCIYFDVADRTHFEELASGSEVNVLSIDADGQMGLRFSSALSDFDAARFGVPVKLQDVNGIWNQDTIYKTVESSGVVYALTESGALVRDVTNEVSVPLDSISFIDICSSENFVYALSDAGEIYVASEGGSFTYIASVEFDDNSVPLYISSVNGLIVIFCEGGIVRSIGTDNSFVTSNLDAAFVASNSNHIVVAENDNDIYVSSNGLFYDSRDAVSALIPEFDSIVDLEIIDEKAYILTQHGTLITFDLVNDEITSCDISSIEPIGICPINADYVVAVSSDYQAYAVNVSVGVVDLLGMGNSVIEKVFRFGVNQFIIVSGSNLYQNSLMSALIVDNPIGSSIVESGDICMVKTSSVDTSSWDIQGETELVQRDDGVYLNGTNSDLHVMSRRLDSIASDLFEDGVFYRIDVSMSSDNGDLNAYVWLEGDEFGQQGMQTTVSSSSEVYSYVFAVTDNMLSDEYLRFNLAFEGFGAVNIDYIYIGPSNSDVNTIPSNFRNHIVYNNPSALRFSSMVIGGTGFCDESFYGVRPDSAESALLMCRDAGANPWFLMGSQITQSDVDNFLGYMCGSVSSEYGKRRIDNGTALPWSRQFNNILVEVYDSEDTFLSDVQRGAYVDYIKTLFERSTYYIEIKDRIVFIDGMNYDGGIVLSSSDRHASSIDINSPITVNNTFEDCVNNAIEAARFNAPRAVGGELISSISLSRYEGFYTAADVVSSVIDMQSSFANLVMFDSDTEVFNTMASLRFLVGAGQLYYEVLDPAYTSSELTGEALANACDFMLVDGNSYIYFIAANHSDSAQQFLPQSSIYDIRTCTYYRYSSDGDLLLERNISRFGLRQNLQPGEYLVISIPK